MMLSSTESITDPKEFKMRLKRLCRKMDGHIFTLEEGNGEMSSAYSSYLSSDKQVQEELILTLSHKHHCDDIETPEDLPSATEIAEILIQLSKEDESTSNSLLGANGIDEWRYGRLFQISDRDASSTLDEIDKNDFFNLITQEMDRGNRRLGTMVKSFENVRAAQYRLVREKLQQMSWDLGEPELILNVAENEKIISSLREQLAAETEREEAQRRQPDYAAEKEETLLSLSKSSEMTKHHAAELEKEVGKVGGDMERCRAQIAQILQEITEEELQEKLDGQDGETIALDVKPPPSAISRSNNSSKSMSRAKSRAMAQAQASANSIWKEDEEIEIPTVAAVDVSGEEELLQRFQKTQHATQRMKQRKHTLKEELKGVQDRVQQQQNELKYLKGVGEREKDSEKTSAVKLHLTRMQKKVAIMEARIKSQTSRLEELQLQERRRQHKDITTNSESMQGLALWQPQDLSAPNPGSATTAQGFPSRKLVLPPAKTHRPEVVATQPAKRETRSIDEAFVHIVAPTEQADGSVSSTAAHGSSVTTAEKKGIKNAVTENTHKVPKPLKVFNKAAPSDIGAITLTRRGAEKRKEAEAALDVVAAAAAEGDPVKSLEEFGQDLHVNEMAVIIERFHEHSRRFVQHSAEGLDVLFPPAPVSLPAVAEVKVPAKVIVGGQSKSKPSIETKESADLTKKVDSALMPDQPATSPRKSKTVSIESKATAATISIPPTNMPLSLPAAVQGRSSPFSVSVSIPLSLPRPQTNKVSEVGGETMDSIFSLEEESEVLNQNFGLKAAVEQLHALLAELSSLSPTKAHAIVEEENKQIDAVRRQKKLHPAVEFSVPVFDDEDCAEEAKPQQQSDSGDEKADAKRELDMERAMGSVEYLRVRINQQLQLLRHVYRDTNAEKTAIKLAKQRVINERMASQNERSKLLMAIDHNKYYWPPDSHPGEMQIQIQRAQQNIARLRVQVKQHGIIKIFLCIYLLILR